MLDCARDLKFSPSAVTWDTLAMTPGYIMIAKIMTKILVAVSETEYGRMSPNPTVDIVAKVQ